MTLFEILEKMNSGKQGQLNVINNAINYDNVKFDKAEAIIISLGLKFKTYNDSEFDLFYDYISRTIIKQKIYYADSDSYKFVGQIFKFDDRKKFISEYCKGILIGADKIGITCIPNYIDSGLLPCTYCIVVWVGITIIKNYIR